MPHLRTTPENFFADAAYADNWDLEWTTAEISAWTDKQTEEDQEELYKLGVMAMDNDYATMAILCSARLAMNNKSFKLSTLTNCDNFIELLKILQDNVDAVQQIITANTQSTVPSQLVNASAPRETIPASWLGKLLYYSKEYALASQNARGAASLANLDQRQLEGQRLQYESIKATYAAAGKSMPYDINKPRSW